MVTPIPSYECEVGGFYHQQGSFIKHCGARLDTCCHLLKSNTHTSNDCHISCTRVHLDVITEPLTDIQADTQSNMLDRRLEKSLDRSAFVRPSFLTWYTDLQVMHFTTLSSIRGLLLWRLSEIMNTKYRPVTSSGRTYNCTSELGHSAVLCLVSKSVTLGHRRLDAE